MQKSSALNIFKYLLLVLLNRKSVRMALAEPFREAAMSKLT